MTRSRSDRALEMCVWMFSSYANAIIATMLGLGGSTDLVRSLGTAGTVAALVSGAVYATLASRELRHEQ